MFDLSLNAIHFNSGIIDGKKYDRYEIINAILSILAYKDAKIMKLKLSQINLNHE